MRQNTKNWHEIILFIRNFIVLALFAWAATAYVNRTGTFPWGSDTYGHLFKGNILYDSIMEGKLFLNYHQSWYNGIQPFRYWAPLPYYVLALINLFTGDIFKTYNAFIALTFFVGGLGWLCWGYYLKRQNLGLAFALLWFFIPDNVRILFSEGNIPFVIVDALIPFVMLYSYISVKSSRLSGYLPLAFIMCMLTLTHAMVTAMTGVALFIYAVADIITNKRYKSSFLMLIYAFMGIMVSSFWLFPALKGGIISIDKGAVASVMQDLTYHLSISLNPLLRFSNIEIYYFGLAFAFAAIFGFLFCYKSQKAHFIVALIILFGTTKAALPLLEKLPFNQLLWMRRFTPIAMAMILIGILLWKNLRKSVLISLVIILMFDSAASFYVLGFNRAFPQDQAKILDRAAGISTQRIAVLDNSYFGSFPSYYIPYSKAKGVKNQVYGWAWQGATTSQNIVMLNTALEKEYHDFMFDRALELGADTLIIKKNFISNFEKLDVIAEKSGYQKWGEDELTLLYKYSVKGSFATKAVYEGIAIGKYATNAIYIFPKLIAGQDDYIDNYTYEDLKNYKTIFLSGFKYYDKQKAEELIIKLSSKGIKVVIDTEGMAEAFLGVSAEPIIINQRFENVFYKNQEVVLQNFPKEYSIWKTGFLRGVDSKDDYLIINHRIMSYLGTKHNENINFVGMNIPYFAFLTKDKTAVRILENIFELEAYEAPKRAVNPINIEYSGNILRISTDKTDVTVPIAALDAFMVQSGRYSVVSNLINIQSNELEIKIVYPYLGVGIIISLVSALLIIIISLIINFYSKRGKVEQSVI